MTDRENFLRCLKRQRPEFVPVLNRAIASVMPSCILDRVDEGYDLFGVKWSGMVPDTSDRLLKDVTEWEKVIKFPDLGKLDWEAAAARDLANVDREKKAVWAAVRVGPFERLHSFMDLRRR